MQRIQPVMDEDDNTYHYIIYSMLQVIIKVELSLIHIIGIINLNISLHTLLVGNNTGEINENVLY